MQIRPVHARFLIFIGISFIAGCTYVVPPPPGFVMNEVQPSPWHAHYRSPEVKAVYDTETDKWYSWENEDCQVCGRKSQEGAYPGRYPIVINDENAPKRAYDRLAEAHAQSIHTRRGWCIVPGFRMPWLPLDFTVKKPVRFICVNPNNE